MERVRELVSGKGVSLPGPGGRAFVGRAVSIEDDLVSYRQEAADTYGMTRGNGRDKGG